MVRGVVGGGGGGGGGVVIISNNKKMEEELSFPILVAERVRKAVEEAESLRAECSELGRLAERLAQMLRSAVRIATLSPSLYDRPIRRVAAEVVRNLERALALVRRCRRNGILRHVIAITGSTDFRKVFALLDASLADMNWLLSVYTSATDTTAAGGSGIVLSLPPIASTDPVLSWVWSSIVVVQMGAVAADRVEAAYTLANLALDNDRNKQMILNEGGVSPLLALLKDGPSLEAQLATATALRNLAGNHEHVSMIIAELAIPIIVQVFTESPMKLQSLIASLVSRMAEYSPEAQEDFARENAIRPLVTMLSFEVPMEDPKLAAVAKNPTTIHSLVQINRKLGTAASSQKNSSHRYNFDGSGRGGSSHHRRERERENESPETKLHLKTLCAEALWKLSAGSISNSRKITETKGLLCLSKIIELNNGELQLNCLMTVMEIASAAENDAELRRSAFRMNSPAAKSVVDQLLRVVREISSPTLQIPAIRSIGSLARTFSARETRVIEPLVGQLSHWNPEVAAEAAIALGKFAGTGNFLCVQHSKAIIEFGGVSALIKLLRSGERAQLNGLILLCYLALHVADSEALVHAKALTALELASRNPIAQDPSLRELLPKAIYQLDLYHSRVHPHEQSYLP